MENAQRHATDSYYDMTRKIIGFKKPPIITRAKNAHNMLKKEGLGPLLYKIRRLTYRRIMTIARAIYPYAGRNLRKKALEYVASGKPLPKLTIIITMLGQHDMTQFCLNKVVQHHKGDVEILIIDNGCDFTPEIPTVSGGPFTLKTIYPPQGNLGVYPVYKFGMEHATGDIVLFLHNDLIINEDAFDIYVRYLIATKPHLGLLGFVGSDEVAKNGGKGYGTTSNYEAKTYTYKDKTWTGTDAKIYGSCYDGYTNAMILDGLAMGFRRTAWKKIGFREDFPPNHYHDRLIPLQVIEAGYKVGIIGIACDHMDAQTRSNEKKYHSIVQGWCEKNNVKPYVDNNGKISWEHAIHMEAQRKLLTEWRDQKHFIPKKAGQWL
jgi:cellulose synthase/poly-beta-1,6-N-acetylglucosamine synthase-like glycosyltransferase